MSHSAQYRHGLVGVAIWVPPIGKVPALTLTLLPDAPSDYFDTDFDDELISELRLAQLVIALSGCRTERALRLVRRRNNETPLERLARSLAATRAELAAA
jgi:hypothetical protein